MAGEDTKYKKAVATAAFEKMSKRQQRALFAAAGLKAGANVSLAYAIDKFRRDKIREIVFYLFFLVIFTTSALIQRNVTDSHYYMQTVKDAILNENFPDVTWFKTFNDVAIDADFWDYMTTVIPQYLYKDKWYNGQQYTSAEMNYVLHVNRLVQAPRIRQLRVNSQICPVPPRLANVIKTCYPAFSTSAENRTSIPGWPPGTLVTYKTASQLATSEYRNGLLPYTGGGFAIDLPLYFNKTQALDFFNYLKSVKWSDLHTRAIFFTFALYNPVNGLYLSVLLLFEFLPFGEVRPSSQFRVIRMGLSTANDYATVLLDAMVYLMVFSYILQDVRKIAAMGRVYWTHFWHWFNWVNYTIFMVSLYFKISFYMASLRYVSGNGNSDMQTATMDFEAIGWTYYQMVNFQAFNNIFVWLRAFTYIKYLTTDIANLSYTLTNAAKDCGLFLLIFAMVIFAYAQAFHIAFGTDIGTYQTLLESIFGLFKTLLGDFNFNAIKSSNAYLGPLLFITFEVVCYFIFLNMFLAILNKSYSDVIDKGVDDPMTVEFRNTLAANFRRFIDRLNLWKSEDGSRNQQEDGDEDEEEVKKIEKKKTALDGEALGMMLNTIQELSTTVRGINEKIENVSKVQSLSGAGRLQVLNRASVAGSLDNRDLDGSNSQNSPISPTDKQLSAVQPDINRNGQKVRSTSKLHDDNLTEELLESDAAGADNRTIQEKQTESAQGNVSGIKQYKRPTLPTLESKTRPDDEEDATPRL
ncbi:hypothetical protein GUITHDRAFT_163814 [Guillardia theta CCMP2712]|uniref:Uncharacterized protein n=2 Tax=Guillardia theta TaxID=55529 RepID=L1J6B8_GUITC|nr:hypothetical protein GUITHDRAFT_163814 [Guillardia theta CCMP2712]EKX43635.1 hypothetical protein GUITHDRAFT_163814 [Guillardia theta CCMP2712]|mmetsp:Transcript_17968/g.59002  ORF Transcript_17968/g.59002 Transcript_17968/m.59002 type:complete len:750 (+) Transcript_17968:53-2302(+)|eukprot:XP_005830615.1 hypothetical protein GUITHDRAFT_163814 [Guillardia theta CCMP2712]